MGDLEHIDVGPRLTKVAWELTTAHHLASQAVGDMIYASTAAQLTGLAIGSNGDLMIASGGIPSWAHILQVETNGLTIGLAAGAPEPALDVLHIYKGAGGAAAAVANTVVVIENDTFAYINFLTTSPAGLAFTDAAGVAGFFLYDHSNFFSMTINGTLRYRFEFDTLSFRGVAATIETTVGDLTHAPANNLVLAPVNNEVVPDADDDVTLGTAGLQWSDLRSVLINGADYGLTLNRWRMLESELYHGYPEGWALGHGHFLEGKMGPQKVGAKPTFVVTDDFIEYQGRRITPAMLDRVLEMVV